MINIDHVTGENIKELNSKWHQIPYYPNRILIAGIFGSTKTNGLLNLGKEPLWSKISITN